LADWVEVAEADSCQRCKGKVHGYECLALWPLVYDIPAVSVVEERASLATLFPLVLHDVETEGVPVLANKVDEDYDAKDQSQHFCDVGGKYLL
jgi:hypothetical protein